MTIHLKKTTTRYVYIRIIIMIIIWNRAKPWGKSPASDLHWHLGTLVLGIDQSVGWFQGLPWPNIPKYIQISTAGWWCNNHLEKYDFVNGKDCPIYEMENSQNVWNHQPVLLIYPGKKWPEITIFNSYLKLPEVKSLPLTIIWPLLTIINFINQH